VDVDIHRVEHHAARGPLEVAEPVPLKPIEPLTKAAAGLNRLLSSTPIARGMKVHFEVLMKFALFKCLFRILVKIAV